MHVTAELADGVQFTMVEHLTELLKLILPLLRLCDALFLIEHAPEGIEICGVFYKTGDVDLRADKVAKIAARVKERCLHEQVHERRAITAAINQLISISWANDNNTY